MTNNVKEVTYWTVKNTLVRLTQYLDIGMPPYEQFGLKQVLQANVVQCLSEAHLTLPDDVGQLIKRTYEKIRSEKITE